MQIRRLGEPVGEVTSPKGQRVVSKVVGDWVVNAKHRPPFPNEAPEEADCGRNCAGPPGADCGRNCPREGESEFGCDCARVVGEEQAFGGDALSLARCRWRRIEGVDLCKLDLCMVSVSTLVASALATS